MNNINEDFQTILEAADDNIEMYIRYTLFEEGKFPELTEKGKQINESLIARKEWLTDHELPRLLQKHINYFRWLQGKFPIYLSLNLAEGMIFDHEGNVVTDPNYVDHWTTGPTA